MEAPFTINVSPEQISELKLKLSTTRLPDELEDAERKYGPRLEDIKRLLSRWTNTYDWKKHEAELNAELPQYTRPFDVDGYGTLDIHYVHKKSTLGTAIPLLFVHGWPGSFIEVRKILPLLTSVSPEQPSFHVVALSLPGFGFSTGPSKSGFGFSQHAEVGHKLMLALGYDEYVTQGGDWGYWITKRGAKLYGGKHLKAWHTNYPRKTESYTPPSFWRHPLIYLSALVTPLTEDEKAGLKRSEWFVKEGRGYSAQQSTQPQTLGYSLADSPVGLLGWIYEKLINWTDDYAWDDDEVLTWVSVYWFSRCGPAATLRIYYEITKKADKTTEESSIPLGHSYFPKELYRVPGRWLWERNLVFEAEHTKGGHFAAHEQPELLVGDLRKMFGRGGGAYGVVTGKDGFANSA
ncbi:Alpha/Beta hydrolase protein [Coprinopsis sp. MPI-PUGE-AT-0042]|nr:Alpha/Beta hydrolase protein [Coprinopsis sp. MPI-PUGE-AT-0042]